MDFVMDVGEGFPADVASWLVRTVGLFDGT